MVLLGEGLSEGGGLSEGVDERMDVRAEQLTDEAGARDAAASTADDTAASTADETAAKTAPADETDDEEGCDPCGFCADGEPIWQR